MNNTLNEKDLAELKEGLKRCSPQTIEAAIQFRETGDVAWVHSIVYGIIARFQPSGARIDTAGDETRLVEDLGLDSLTLLEVLLSIEEVLQLRVDNEELREIRTLGELNRFLQSKLKEAPLSPAQYDHGQISMLLPQQDPFLFLDDAELDETSVRARYLVRGDESFLAGHFKDEPVFPASILFEAIGQAATLWILEKVPAILGKSISSRHVFFGSLDGARVHRKVRPGEQLAIEGTLLKLREPVAIFRGSITSGDAQVAVIERLILAFGDEVLPEADSMSASL
ncbi:MAG: Beta-hydroxyacyl-(acyl-carrier-protein) dehydratase FabA/FabZ [Chthoniobacteraceae bacterium]|nr:Beta-hydroxyacyl-(acyl-carrier-protein) dehydratase FabA/FabZ [Chthoniobacteraceae bacterium]